MVRHVFEFRLSAHEGLKVEEVASETQDCNTEGSPNQERESML